MAMEAETILFPKPLLYPWRFRITLGTSRISSPQLTALAKSQLHPRFTEDITSGDITPFRQQTFSLFLPASIQRSAYTHQLFADTILSSNSCQDSDEKNMHIVSRIAPFVCTFFFYSTTRRREKIFSSSLAMALLGLLARLLCVHCELCILHSKHCSPSDWWRRWCRSPSHKQTNRRISAVAGWPERGMAWWLSSIGSKSRTMFEKVDIKLMSLFQRK